MRTHKYTQSEPSLCALIAALLGAALLFVSPLIVLADGSNRNAKAIEHLEGVCAKLNERAHATVPPFCIPQDGGGDEEEDPEEPAGVGHLLISEVLYDLKGDGSQGSEVGGDNEWVEIHNPTGTAIDLAGWYIGVSTTSGDVISEVSLLIDPGEFIVITDAESTADFWDLSNVTVVYLGSSISGGLRNAGDTVALFDESGAQIDAVSYGDDVTAFDPAVSLAPEGSSLARSDLWVDTDTALDWEVSEVPTPGV